MPPLDEPEAFVAAHQRLIEAFEVDLLIANRDRDVRVFAAQREALACRHFIPDAAQVAAVQDKLRLSDWSST